jgi:thymidylate synthase ThyX
MNFQGFQDFLKNRTSKTAQWEIRQVAIDIEKQLHNIAPNIF